MYPDYFLITLTVCIGILTVLLLEKNTRQLRRRRRRSLDDDLQEMREQLASSWYADMDKLREELKNSFRVPTQEDHSAYHKAIVDLINALIQRFERLVYTLDDPQNLPIIITANSLDTVKSFGHIQYLKNENRVAFVIH